MDHFNQSYFYIFREKERLSTNIIRPIGPQNRSVTVVKFRPRLFNVHCTLIPATNLTDKYLYLHFLRDLLTDIMDSTHCVKEQESLVKEFLSSGNRWRDELNYFFLMLCRFCIIFLLVQCRYSDNRMFLCIFVCVL